MEFSDFSLLIGLTDKSFVLAGARITVGVGNKIDLTFVRDNILGKLEVVDFVCEGTVVPQEQKPNENHNG
jgi:hypothetical protein